MMKMRKLGKSSLNASSIGLGLMSMSGTYGKSDDQESIGVIHRALAKVPGQRYAGAAAMADDLRTGSTLATTSPDGRERSHGSSCCPSVCCVPMPRSIS